jgi:protein TonB
MTATGGNAPAVAPSARQPHGSGEPAIQSYDKLTDDIIFRNRLYPSMARNRKIEGVVRMTVTIDKTGRASNIRVVKTSGSSTLDRASVQTIQRCLFPPPPTDLITLTKTITFRLEDDSRS